MQHSNYQSAPPNLFSIHDKPFGISYADWCVRWIKWCLETPADINPAKDPEGKFANSNQPTDAPVFYLAGNFMRNTQTVTRNIEIPAGKYLLFPILEKECSFDEDIDLHTEEQLIDRTTDHTSRITHIECQINGHYIEDIYAHKLQLPVYDLTFPDNNVYGVHGIKTRSTSNGFWIFLNHALQYGRDYTIYFKGINEQPFFYIEMTYNIKTC